MKRVLGIFRGFPGLGRVVAGVSLLETLRDKYDCTVKFISYLQGNKYLESRGYTDLEEVTPMDYCSIGLLPTNKMGVYIHDVIKNLMPDVIVVDGEPLILQSIKISHPNTKVVALLNPTDVDNPNNDKEAMDFFNTMYSLSDLAIVHGLRVIPKDNRYNNLISTNTILRSEILSIQNTPTNNIYCILGGGTVNVSSQFEVSTLRIGRLCKNVATFFPQYNMHIICSSPNIYNYLKIGEPNNVYIYDEIIPAEEYYSKACLVITRSGRNTLSELAYLGIPAISFVTGDKYRVDEQSQNAKDAGSNTQIVSPDISIDEFKKLIYEMIKQKNKIPIFKPGNQMCINSIVSL